MRLVIISSAPIISQDDNYFAYSPYVKELNYWAKNVDEIAFVTAVWDHDRNILNTKINFPITQVYKLKEIDITSFKNAMIAFVFSFYNCFVLYKAMKSADHIHLRCPGNNGFLGSIVQIFFPKKVKTAKYAGNWDPNSKEPWSYRLQKWILENTFLTKNIKVLVYGEWENSTKNIKPFFTASYYEKDKIAVSPRPFDTSISFVFVGTLSNGKQPLYAVQLVERLRRQGKNVQLTLFGEGYERELLEKYISNKMIGDFIWLKGNQDQEIIKKAYLENHFVILPSLSEGWPKVVAEGMFWGCLPIVTKVSCVPNMLANGDRGVLLELDLAKDVKQLELLLDDYSLYQSKVIMAVDWSRKYTLDLFESEIKMLLS